MNLAKALFHLAAAVFGIQMSPGALAEETNLIAKTGSGAAVIYVPFIKTLPVNSNVWLNVDDQVAKTNLRATQRSLGFREVDYKAIVSAALSLSPVKPVTTGGITRYDYSSQNNKGSDLIAFWKEKDLPIIIGPDGLAYITDGHHTSAGYLAANATMPREIVPGNEHVVLGHITASYFTGVAVAPTDTWWQTLQAGNNAFLYGPKGNQLIRPFESGYSGLQTILASQLALPTVPGKVSMTNDDYRSLTWGMVDPIVKTAATTPTSSSYLKGFSKGFPSGWVNPDPAHLVADAATDINFVEFYWADFLRNRIVWNNQLPGCALDATDPACAGKKNLIGAPISFFAAVANGIALSRSESYFDQFGRTLSDYLAADFSANTRTWASASIQNGLASGKNCFHMYLLDDSSVKGDIAPSSLDTVTNSLHIDTTAGQVIAGSIRNFAAVDINRGATIETKWKETPALMRFLGTNPETSLVIPAGTGAVTFAGMNSYPGTTTVAAGKLIVSSTGAISSNSKLEVLSGAMLRNDGKISVGSYDQQGNAALSMSLNERGEVNPLIVAGNANLNGTLNLRNGSKKWIRGRTYKLLNAGSIKGVFTDVTTEVNLAPRLKYGKNAVTMTLEAKEPKRSTSLKKHGAAKQAIELNTTS